MRASDLAELTLPSPDEEVWRYSRIAELDPSAFAPAAADPGAGVPDEVWDLAGRLGERAGLVVRRNGGVVHAELEARWADAGVRFGPDAAAPDPVDDPPDAFATLAVGSEAPVTVEVPAGVVVEAPLVLIDWVDEAGAAVAARLVVRVGEAAQVKVLDWQGGSPDGPALVLAAVELDLAQAAHLGYANVQDRGPSVWQIAWQTSRVERDATLTAGQAALGGDYTRARTDCRLVGRGASGTLQAAYFGTGDQTLDFRTFQDHAAPDTTSNLLFKGAVDDRSRSVYTGLIRVRKEARGTNAFQTNRNLKLGEHAWAESVPNLEIENNEVRCSHASTVGPVDEDQRFYLESRGVPTEVAERLVVAGFFQEVLAQLPVPGVAPLLEAEIERRLTAGDPA